MNAMLLAMAQLADAQSRYRSLHEHLSRPTNPWWSMLWWTLGLATATLLMIVIVRLARRRSHQKEINRPWALFLRLLWHAPLSWAQRWALFRIAWRASRRCPAAILMTPSSLRHAALAWAGGEEGLLWPTSIGRRLDPIGRVLFGESVGK